MSEVEIGPSSMVMARDDLFSTSVGDDLVLFDAAQGTYFGSGLVGQTIWNTISETKSVKSVCNELLDQFNIDPQTCERQVIAFLAELNSRGLIKVT